MSEIVPPVPLKSELTDANGFLSPAWAGFFKQLFNRIGGAVALTNIELATQIGDVPTIQANLTALQATVANLQSMINDLNQGPKL